MTNIEVVIRYYYHWFKCKVIPNKIMKVGMARYRVLSLQTQIENKSADDVLEILDSVKTQLDYIQQDAQPNR